jgi:DnaJ-class molecular chaperone
MVQSTMGLSEDWGTGDKNKCRRCHGTGHVKRLGHIGLGLGQGQIPCSDCGGTGELPSDSGSLY